MGDKKTCFVVMGFGRKPDLATGRILDLDKSYRNIIKPAAAAAGLECTRADEILHSGIIDVPMYEQLLCADVVVADISTSNCNAFYELGVRHALKPFTTITIAENQMTLPFDATHLLVRRYQHLGDGIDYDEVVRMQGDLTRAMQAITSPANDSPVYIFLKNLKPPEVKEATGAFAAATGKAAGGTGGGAVNPTVSALMGQADAAMQKGDFPSAKALLAAVRTLMPNDPYYAQQLALATYKSKQPTPRQALDDAKAILGDLNPALSTDAETLGLWGAVHKRRWDLSGEIADLDMAIHSYEKGFFLKNDHYNGINLAFLCNVRSTRSTGAEAIADFINAQRKRRKVLDICASQLGAALPDDKKYWILATMAEAWFGLDDKAKGQQYLDQAFALNPAQWMKDSTLEQLSSLDKLLAQSPLGSRAAPAASATPAQS